MGWIDMVAGLAGKVVVVTGAARGIGEATLKLLAERGATVAGLDRDGALGHEAISDIDGDAMFCLADVTDGQSVDAAIEAVVSRHGRIDGLVNNAGVAAYFDAASMSESEWDQVFAVDLKGVWRCVRAVLPIMRQQGSGSIVNMSSIHARMTEAGSFPYAAAKAGVGGLTRSLALDEGRHGIRVNAVCPGYVRTRLVDAYFDQQPDPAETRQRVYDVHPLGRVVEPAEVASVVAFLVGDDSSGITGSEVTVDGGLTARFA